jgi:pyruvate carboxylase
MEMQRKTFDQVVEFLRAKPILVANRGISARRIARAIREVIRAVPIMTATDVDKTSPATSSAQELILLGENTRAYLDLELIIRKAKERGVLGIHPGWGFAAEDDSFPGLCAEAGIVFIGPDAAAMRQLGNKVAVRALARKLGVPVIPGSTDAVSLDQALADAREIGYPVMLKSEGGGGGRGIYAVFSDEELEAAYPKATVMAQASFGNPRLYVEKFLTSVRHIEIQVVADRWGNVVALDERDCSVQRKNQKLIEITPSPWSGMTDELRRQLKEWSAKLIKETGYYSLATVEYLVEPDGTAYLVEVNTRLQVEHGITECRYGIDLVEEQIAIAFGSELRLTPHMPALTHAMEVRINCEDPQDGFSPNSGRVTRYLSPGGQGIRIDSCISAGYEFPPDYDSAAVLLTTYASSYPKALGIMRRALHEYTFRGVKTTIPFFQKVIENEAFQEGEFDTKFLETAPELTDYQYVQPKYFRNSRLVAEISAMGYNPFLQLGEYRDASSKRIGRFEPTLPDIDFKSCGESPYPRWDCQGLLDVVRDSKTVHVTDTTGRDITQSNSGNRFRLAEDRLIGPYLDNCGFFSLENGGGAHFHVAMMANMTYPFSEGAEWNAFAPKTPKQILVRSTNLLGYKPQPPNLMRMTGEMICEHYDVVRCFDFLNDVRNMRPIAEVVLASGRNVFEPAISLSYAEGFDVGHYLGVTDAIIDFVRDITGGSSRDASRRIILGLKDMGGVCPPRFLRALIGAIRDRYPDLVLHYHRHCTDGLFVPAVGAAAKAGAHIIDTGIGSAVRWYGQGDVLSTVAYLEEELGMSTTVSKEMIRHAGFALKQIMPYFDRYVAPYFQGIDHDVVSHGMPGGATSSSQEGAMKHGYIHLLPYMLRFLSGTRKIVRYHDVTPGSQITWNTAFLAVTEAYKRGGTEDVENLLAILDEVVATEEKDLSPATKKARLILYANANDSFRDLLRGKFGRMPLGFPPDWVYESAFVSDYKEALASRTEGCPLDLLTDINLDAEHHALRKALRREPTQEEFVMYLNHPADALKTIRFSDTFGNANQIPLDVWFEGLEIGEKLLYLDGNAKPHEMHIISLTPPDDQGNSTVRYVLDHTFLVHDVKVAEPVAGGADSALELADTDNPYHVGAPSSGDLWAVYVRPGDFVRKGDELCNISIMKQEKAIMSPHDGVVKRVLKYANYEDDKKMVAVKSGELLIELMAAHDTCEVCHQEIAESRFAFCPHCGAKTKAMRETGSQAHQSN